MNHYLKGGMSGDVLVYCIYCRWMRKQPADVVNERKPLVGLFDLSVYYAITSFSILSGLLGFFFFCSAFTVSFQKVSFREMMPAVCSSLTFGFDGKGEKRNDGTFCVIRAHSVRLRYCPSTKPAVGSHFSSCHIILNFISNN